MSPLDRHSNTVLQLSGGKDSLACLLLLKEELHRITVVWVNTGAAFPETLAQMAQIQKMCPRFMEVRSNQPEQIEENGYPVDVLPVKCHPRVQEMTSVRRVKMQDFMQCCVNNVMLPMQKACRSIGATLIIRGQKDADVLKGGLRSGDVEDGVEYWYPIQDWTDEQVLDMVTKHDMLPAHYNEGANTSMDCWSCSAYLEDNEWKLPYLEKHYPDKATEMKRRFKVIRGEIEHDLIWLKRI